MYDVGCRMYDIEENESVGVEGCINEHTQFEIYAMVPSPSETVTSYMAIKYTRNDSTAAVKIYFLIIWNKKNFGIRHISI